MGIADLVPGISGSTIALILGIYTDLISSLKNLKLDLLKNLVRFEIKEIQEKLNIKFLFFLISGIIFSFIFLSKIIQILLIRDLSKICLYGIFLGAALASIFFLAKSIKNKNVYTLLFFVLGLFISIAFLFFRKQTNVAVSEITLVLAGMFAMMAMLLPGISGSFVFLIIGVYPKIIQSLSNIHSMDSVKTLFFVFLGILISVFTFPKIIFFSLKKYFDATVSFLTGLMLGSIPSLWPFSKNEMIGFNFFSFKFFVFSLFVIVSFFLFFKLKQNFEEKKV